jgi:rhamnosyltransferase
LKLVTILVLYLPDIDKVEIIIKKLYDHSNYIYIIDNSPINNDSKFFNNDKVIYKHIEKNVGTSGAYNYVFKQFINHYNIEDFNFLTLDQDSTFSDDFLVNMVDLLSKVNDREYEGMFDKGKQISNDFTRVNQVISSGAFIKGKFLKNIGFFDELLFLDLVDFDWCWKANNKGFELYKANNIYMKHMVGEKEYRIYKIRLSIPSISRIYYIVRNYFILLKRNYVPLIWKIKYGTKLILKFFIFFYFYNFSILFIKNYLNGIKDGLVFFFKINSDKKNNYIN